MLANDDVIDRIVFCITEPALYQLAQTCKLYHERSRVKRDSIKHALQIGCKFGLQFHTTICIWQLSHEFIEWIGVGCGQSLSAIEFDTVDVATMEVFKKSMSTSIAPSLVLSNLTTLTIGKTEDDDDNESNVYGDTFDDTCATIFQSCVESGALCNLSTLTLRHQRITCDGFVSIMQTAWLLPHLNTIDLHDNQIGNRAMAMMTDIQIDRRHCSALFLTRNPIDVDGIHALVAWNTPCTYKNSRMTSCSVTLTISDTILNKIKTTFDIVLGFHAGGSYCNLMTRFSMTCMDHQTMILELFCGYQPPTGINRLNQSNTL